MKVLLIVVAVFAFVGYNTTSFKWNGEELWDTTHKWQSFKNVVAKIVE